MVGAVTAIRIHAKRWRRRRKQAARLTFAVRRTPSRSAPGRRRGTGTDGGLA